MKIMEGEGSIKTIYCLLGPSGSGKTTLGEYLKKTLKIEELISCTTRPKRRGEKQGDPYHFISRDQFQNIEMIEAVEYSGNYYGLSKKELRNKLDNNNKVYVIIDKEGIKQLKRIYPDIDIEVIYIYATIDECIERMSHRDTEEVLNRVINMMKDEEFNNFDIADYIIRNKDLDKAKRQIEFIVKN